MPIMRSDARAGSGARATSEFARRVVMIQVEFAALFAIPIVPVVDAVAVGVDPPVFDTASPPGTVVRKTLLEPNLAIAAFAMVPGALS